MVYCTYPQVIALILSPAMLPCSSVTVCGHNAAHGQAYRDGDGDENRDEGLGQGHGMGYRDGDRNAG